MKKNNNLMLKFLTRNFGKIFKGTKSRLYLRHNKISDIRFTLEKKLCPRKKNTPL